MEYKGANWLGIAAVLVASVAPVEAQRSCPDFKQVWDEPTKVLFWYTSQGSRVLDYKVFRALQVAGGGSAKFADRLDRFGYIRMPALTDDKAKQLARKLNRDNLPIGFALDTDAQSREYVGFTCAACHTGQIQIDDAGSWCVVEGAPGMADFQGFVKGLNQSIEETLQPAKLASTAQAVGMSQSALRALLQTANVDLIRRLSFEGNTKSGHGRVDAFGQIFNRVIEPAKPANAPVSYPHLWDTTALDRVQWNAAARNNVPMGPLLRNVGEALGVFGDINVADRPKGKLGSPSSLRIAELRALETWVSTLAKPRWPSEWKQSADTERGAKMYKANCATCHRLPGDPKYLNVTLHPTGSEDGSISENAAVDTDPTMTENVYRRKRELARYADAIYRPTRITFTKPLAVLQKTSAPGVKLLGQAVVEAILAGDKHIGVEALKGLETATVSAADMVTENKRYRARPLAGIWATGPFLHNGSVPTIADLLKPAWTGSGPVPVSERDKYRPTMFTVGCLQYDQDALGFVQSCSGSTFTFDTSLPGNSNRGHLWGTKLDADDRRALIEYLKTL
jgi:hypothetical protein